MDTVDPREAVVSRGRVGHSPIHPLSGASRVNRCRRFRCSCHRGQSAPGRSVASPRIWLDSVGFLIPQRPSFAVDPRPPGATKVATRALSMSNVIALAASRSHQGRRRTVARCWKMP